MNNLPITNKHLWTKYDGEKNSYYIHKSQNRKEEFVDTDETAFMTHLKEYHHCLFHDWNSEGIRVIINK